MSDCPHPSRSYEDLQRGLAHIGRSVVRSFDEDGVFWAYILKIAIATHILIYKASGVLEESIGFACIVVASAVLTLYENDQRVTHYE